nr:hypothetical protein [Sunxiuqinia sp.]
MAGAIPVAMSLQSSALNAFVSEPLRKDGPSIRKIKVFSSSANFYRYIGVNAYGKKSFGINRQKMSFTIELSDGTIGIGTFGNIGINNDSAEVVRELLGKNILGFYQWKNDQIIGVSPEYRKYFFDTRYSWIESGILDAVGKIMNVPVWKLFGKAIRNGIDPYDGTVYFEEIVHNTDVSIIAAVGKRIKADGYRAIKIKLGRPYQWVSGEAGMNRDVEAFIALREAVGNNIKIMADANDGYQNHFDLAVELMKKCAPYDMYFMEELFPDDAALYKKMRFALLEHNYFIPFAEGESFRTGEEFESACKDHIYNYLQPDMATWGVSNMLATATYAEKFPDIKLIPHVWHNQIGLIMSLHVSKLKKNIAYVEDSRFSEHIYECGRYIFRDGQWFIPDESGWGIALAPDNEQFIVAQHMEIA